MGTGHSKTIDPAMINKAGNYTAAYLKSTKGGYSYSVGYAPTGTSKCRECKENIPKGALRLSRSAPNPFDAKGGRTLLTQHFFPRHAFAAFMRSKCTSHVPLKVQDLEGLGSLTPGDKKMVSAELSKFVVAWKKQCAKLNRLPPK
jgi:hypothetical protein